MPSLALSEEGHHLVPPHTLEGPARRASVWRAGGMWMWFGWQLSIHILPALPKICAWRKLAAELFRDLHGTAAQQPAHHCRFGQVFSTRRNLSLEFSCCWCLYSLHFCTTASCARLWGTNSLPEQNAAEAWAAQGMHHAPASSCMVGQELMPLKEDNEHHKYTKHWPTAWPTSPTTPPWSWGQPSHHWLDISVTANGQGPVQAFNKLLNARVLKALRSFQNSVSGSLFVAFITASARSVLSLHPYPGRIPPFASKFFLC